MKKRIIKISIVLVFIAGIYLLVMYKLGDRILNELIDQQLAELEQIELDFLGSEPYEEKASDIDLSLNEDKPEDISSAEDAEKKPDMLGNKPGNKPDNKSDNKPDKGGDKPAITVTREKLETAKEKISAADKVTVANFLMKKLSKDDINEIKTMMAGGLTAQNKKRIKEIAYTRFTQEEINTIIELYTKYFE